MTWLVVEDEEDIRNIVGFMFKSWGHPMMAFPDGEKTWRWLDQVENGSYEGSLPELALLDIRMPGHRGDEIGGRIRRTSALSHIPIILMTAFTLTNTDRERVMQTAGADRLIMKPLPDMNELRDILHTVLADKQAGRI